MKRAFVGFLLTIAAWALMEERVRAGDVVIEDATDWADLVQIDGNLDIYATIKADPNRSKLEIRAKRITFHDYGRIVAVYRKSHMAFGTGKEGEGIAGGGGGSHAGIGGPGESYTNPTTHTTDMPGMPGKPYGNIWSFYPGAPGAYAKEDRGFGGGAVKLVAQEIILQGYGSSILCDGDDGSLSNSDPGGGGAGGFIWLVADRIMIGENACISASGGSGWDRGGDGGGGIIRIGYVSHFQCDGLLRTLGYTNGLIAVQQIASLEKQDVPALSNKTADLNGDGAITANDLFIFQGNWHR